MPTTMKAWTAPIPLPHSSLSTSMTLTSSHPIPTPTQPTDVQIRIHSASLNPADHKVPEAPLLPRLLLPNPYIPAQDFSGVVTALGSSITDLRVGDAVFGSTFGQQMGRGTLAEYVVVDRAMVAAIPAPLRGKWDDMAGVGIAGLTAYQAIVPHVTKGDRVFVNGGSGGTGIYSIQIAKALGCWVTTTCSGRNVALCKELGADEVVDYTTTDVVAALLRSSSSSSSSSNTANKYKLVVDNVGAPLDLYHASNAFTTPENATFVQVGASLNVQQVRQVSANFLWPRLLGGGKARYEMLLVKGRRDELERMAGWMADGTVRTVVDEVVGFGEADRGFERVESGRARGKVVVRVRGEDVE